MIIGMLKNIALRTVCSIAYLFLVFMAARYWWLEQMERRLKNQTIRALRALDDKTLADIGLRRDEIEQSIR